MLTFGFWYPLCSRCLCCVLTVSVPTERFTVVPGKKWNQVSCLFVCCLYLYAYHIKCKTFLLTRHFPTSATCPHPKVYFNCPTSGTGELGHQCAQTCLNLDIDECVSCLVLFEIIGSVIGNHLHSGCDCKIDGAPTSQSFVCLLLLHRVLHSCLSLRTPPTASLAASVQLASSTTVWVPVWGKVNVRVSTMAASTPPGRRLSMSATTGEWVFFFHNTAHKQLIVQLNDV